MVALLLAAALHAFVQERPRSGAEGTQEIVVSTEPAIRYFWSEVPDDAVEDPLRTADFSNIEPADFVGPDACRECHEDKYAAWSDHRHRFMNAPARTDTVLGDFDGGSIEYYGGSARFEADGDRLLMRLERGELRRVYRVTQTIGSRFFQYYVGVQIEGPEPVSHALYASEHVLPFGYWLDRAEWVPVVHVEKTREGEPSLVDAMRRDPYADPAVFDYAQSCSQCHTTLPTGDWLVHRTPSFPESPRGFAFELGSYVDDNHAESLAGRSLDRMDDRAREDVLRRITLRKAPVWETASGVNCEACHYGNRNHVESAGVILPNLFPTSPRLRLARREDGAGIERNAVNQNWTCGRCHQGERFEFAGGMSTWNSTEHTDAMEGACYRSPDPARETLRCIDCHNPHETTGSAWSRTPDEDDELCLRCHEPLRPAPARQAHTHHPTGSSGSRCMNCHMPRLNEGLQDLVRTHTIFSPTNEAMLEANQPNACNLCHVRETIAWTVRYLERWYGRTPVARDASELPATIEWLRSWHPTTRMVAADALTRASADWALPDLVEALDNDYLLVRQFAQIGLERMLDVRLARFGYRFYMFSRERQPAVGAIRDHYGIEPIETSPTAASDDRLRHYRSLVEFRPDSPTAHYYLANVLLERGVVDEAETHYRRAIGLDPDFARAHNNLGIALKERGLVEAALERHRVALRLEPQLVEAHVALGNVHLASGRTDEARAEFTRAVELDPDRADAHYNLGLLHHEGDDRPSAVEAYRRAVAIDPEYHEAYNNLGIALAESGRHDEAAAALALALDGPAEVARSARLNLAWAHLLGEDPERALPHFEGTLEDDAASISARVGLAIVLTSPELGRSRDPARAVELAEEADGATGGTSVEVLDALARAYAAAGRVEDAIATTSRALELAADDPGLTRELRVLLERYQEALGRR